MGRLIRGGAALVSVVLTACGGGGPGGVSTPPEGGQVLLRDDFSDASTGWLGGDTASFTGENSDQEIADGVFRVFIKTPEGRGGPDTTGLAVDDAAELESLGDVLVEVQAARTTSPRGYLYGVLCRMQDFDNFYGFVIVDGGRYAIFKLSGGRATNLATGASDLIGQGDAAENRLGADCVGDDLTMSIDGQEVATATDREFDEGAVGLLAETRGEAGLEVLFDDLVIRAA